MRQRTRMQAATGQMKIPTSDPAKQKRLSTPDSRDCRIRVLIPERDSPDSLLQTVHH